MADLKILNPKIKGKLKLPDEIASKALQISAIGELEAAAVSTTELGHLAGVTSAIQTQIGSKADTSSLSGYVATSVTVNGHALSSNVIVTKSDVSLGNVDNTSDVNKPVSTAQQTALDFKADLASPTFTGTVSGISKSMVGLGNVDNTSDANKPVSTAQGLADTAVQNFSIARANHTGSQTASTISDFSSAAKAAAVADSIADAVIDVAPSQNAVFDALALKINSSLIGANSGVASLDSNGKLLVGQIPSLAITDTFVVASQAAMLALTAQTGDVAVRSDESKTYILQGSDPTILGNWVFLATPASSVLSVNSQTGVVVLTTADIADSSNKRYVTDADLVDIGNLSGTNTGDQTAITVANTPAGTIVATNVQAAINELDTEKVATTVTVNGHALSANVTVTKSDVGLGNVDNVQQLPMSYLDTDNTLAADSDVKVASQKAIKAYVTTAVGASSHTGDIAHTSFAAANNIVAAASVTGLAFAAGSVRSFKVQISVSIDATTDLNEIFDLQGIQLAGGFVMASSSVGDDSGVVFTVTSAGQVQYTSANSAGFVSNSVKFRATVTDV